MTRSFDHSSIQCDCRHCFACCSVVKSTPQCMCLVWTDERSGVVTPLGYTIQLLLHRFGCQMPDDCFGCQMPDDCFGCQMPDDCFGCQMPDDCFGCQMTASAARCQTTASAARCQMTASAARCQMTASAARCQMTASADPWESFDVLSMSPSSGALVHQRLATITHYALHQCECSIRLAVTPPPPSPIVFHGHKNVHIPSACARPKWNSWNVNEIGT